MALPLGLACAALLVLLLATPIHLHVAVERERAVEACLRLSWLFGLVRFQIHPRPARERPKGEQERPGRPRRERGARIARRVRGSLLRPDLRARTLDLLHDLLNAVRPRGVRLRARIGMDDPADTGVLWGILGPLGAVLANRDVHLEPDFEGACLRFHLAARVRLIPGQLLLLTLAFLLSPPVVRAYFAR